MPSHPRREQVSTGVRDVYVIGGGVGAVRPAAAARGSAEERRKQTLLSRDTPRLSSRGWPGRETRPSAPACCKRVLPCLAFVRVSAPSVLHERVRAHLECACACVCVCLHVRVGLPAHPPARSNTLPFGFASRQGMHLRANSGHQDRHWPSLLQRQHASTEQP